MYVCTCINDNQHSSSKSQCIVMILVQNPLEIKSSACFQFQLSPNPWHPFFGETLLDTPDLDQLLA